MIKSKTSAVNYDYLFCSSGKLIRFLLLVSLSQKYMRCNHTVTYCLSGHSQEFMSPAIDLWHDAQDGGHGWLTLTSMLVKVVLASLKQIRIPAISDTLADVIQSPMNYV